MTHFSETHQDNSVDISATGTNFDIQCANIRLLSSSLRPIDFSVENISNSSFKFSIDAVIKENLAFSKMHVLIEYVRKAGEDARLGYSLDFDMVCTFLPNQEVTQDILSNFARLYTFSILWPYAREYVSDQLRRTGERVDPLPIVNAQKITEQLIKEGLINVIIENENSVDSD